MPPVVACILLLCVGCVGDDRPSPVSAQNERGPIVVRLTGADYRWRARYAGPDGRFDTADDVMTEGDIRVPVDTPVELDLRSEDYLYTLAIPHLDLKEIAVPDLSFRLSFVPDAVGTFDLQGDRMCGYDHAGLKTHLVVMPRSEFDHWRRKGNR